MLKETLSEMLESKTLYKTDLRISKTEEEIYLIFTSSNPVEQIRKADLKEKDIKRMISCLESKYTKEDVELLTGYYNEYCKKYKVKPVQEEKKDELKEKSKYILVDVVMSGLSVAEYASKNLYLDINDIKQAIKNLTSETGKTYQRIVDEINSRESKTFQDEMKDILSEMGSSDFDIIDYYSRTKLSLNDFKKIVGSARSLSIFMGKYKNCASRSKYRDPSKFKEEQYDKLHVMQGIIITNEDREIVFKYMDENQIPYTEETYRAVLGKYLDDNLYKIGNEKAMI